jgi:hypothetical protein
MHRIPNIDFKPDEKTVGVTPKPGKFYLYPIRHIHHITVCVVAAEDLLNLPDVPVVLGENVEFDDLDGALERAKEFNAEHKRQHTK